MPFSTDRADIVSTAGSIGEPQAPPIDRPAVRRDGQSASSPPDPGSARPPQDPQLPPSRLFSELEGELAALEDLPRGLWLGCLINSQGRLEDRLPALDAMLCELTAGAHPSAMGWPGGRTDAALASILRELELPGFCRGQPELAELVLRSLLWHLDRIVDYRDRGDHITDAERRAMEAFADDWRERCGAMREFTEVFGELDDLLKNTRWDLLHGLLRRQGWQDVVRIRRLIERLPELAKVIRRLGRARMTEQTDDSLRRDVEVMEETSAPRAERRVIRVPELPGETRGIRRSARFARMLPAETMLLTHPRLRLIWHARHAERSLLTYEDDDRLQEIRHENRPTWRPSRQRQPDRRLEMGPMLICVDTSGSMQGGAEAVAKAAVLEAVRCAWEQKRACHVFAFGGPNEIVEMELAADAQGLDRLIGFIGQTFQGGTDICGPLERVLEKIADERWQLADLLVASDGEFGATPETARRLAMTREESGLRVQGILIGDRETIGLSEIADDILWIRDWRRYGSSDAASPVHSSRLTATYFPGALRDAGRSPATIAGTAAAAAIRGGLSPTRRGPDAGDGSGRR